MAANKPHTKISDQDRQLILSEIENGASLKRVAKMVNRSVGSISSVLNIHRRKNEVEDSEFFNVDKYTKTIVNI